jgi:serine/threonine protein kinase
VEEGDMELTVPNVYGLLLRSKLLSVDDAKAMFARWQEEARDAAGNVARFAAWMVANKYLTEYQAALLVRGHAEGFSVNEYKILDRLGKGRMAGVYKARHRLGQVVAIKILPPSKAREPNLLARFQREASLAIRLKHPNIVRAFQVGLADGLHYLVMEYLEGETLQDVLDRRGKLPPAEAARVIHQALQGLQHIHQQGLIHRDLKPANLMLVGPRGGADTTLQATVKILDIGLGRALSEVGFVDQAYDPGLTGEGVLLGTPDYMAPEQARDARAADIRADVYSLGCVLYHCLTGQPPFPDVNVISQMIRHATEQPRPLKDLNPAVPDGLQQIVNWMLAKDPAGRYPTPERAAQAMQVFLIAGNDPLAVPESDPNMRPFLTWLEVENKKTPLPAAPAVVKTKPSSDTLPVAPAAAQRSAAQVEKVRTDKPARPDKARAAGPSHSGGKRRHKKGRRPPPVPPALPPPPGAPPSFDVELVPVPVPVGGQKGTGLRLSRRDFTFFGIGAGAGALAAAAGLGVALALFFRNRPPRTEENDTPKDKEN